MNRFAPVVAAALFAAAGTAQYAVFGGNSPRMSTTKMFWDQGAQQMAGMVCIQYGQPEWKAEYNDMVEQAKGKNARLGKDYWTTFNTSVALTMGGVKVAAGSYFLGAHVDDEGAIHLLVIDAKTADANGWTPFGTDDWQATYTIPLEHDDEADQTAKLTISLEGDAADALTLKLAWGNHALTAKVTAHVGGHDKKTEDAAMKRGDKVKKD